MGENENPWKINGSSEVYDNPWIKVTEYDVINPGGGKGIYGKVHFKNKAIGVVPVDAAWNTYLVGQYRFTMNKYSWEIPEGGCPYGESELGAAKRELAEETGLVANEWEILLTMDLSNSVTDEEAIIFLAKELRQGKADPEETEQLHVKKVPITTAFEMVENGTITDAMSVAALLKIQLLMEKGLL